MKARKLSEQAAFGPQTLKVIGQAFDEAWANIAGNFGGEPLRVQAARLKLANAILENAGAGQRDCAALKEAALKSLAQEYKQLGARTQAPQ